MMILDVLNELVFWGLAVIVFFQLIYYWFFYIRLAFWKENVGDSAKKAVSVVICAKNEYQNLKENLPLILSQDYPEFEVVVVNDGSDDESHFLLDDLARKNSHLKVVHLKENVNFYKGKKLALAVGIKSASYDTLLLTDADCKPLSKDWISLMQSQFTSGKQIVLGYGAYQKKNGFLNKLIRFETLVTAMRYMSRAMAGKPYMGVGRNLMYSKKLFYQAGGFAAHYKVISGDDDLFVNQVATKSNTAIQLVPASFTESKPKESFKTWFFQKKRHMAAGSYYKGSHKLVLGFEALINLLFYVFAVAALISLFRWEYVIGILFLKYVSYFFSIYYAANRMNEKELLLYSPLFDLIFAFLNPVFTISNLVAKKNKWK